MNDILKFSAIIFIFAISSSYLSSCFAIDLKIRNYDESLIGLSLSFFGLGVMLSAIFHNYIRKKIKILSSLLIAALFQSILVSFLLFDIHLLTIGFIIFFIGFTNGLNIMTIETHISSIYTKTSGFYIGLFWTSAGLGAISGTLIIALNGINEFSYQIGLVLILLQFIPIVLSKSNLNKINLEKVAFAFSYNVVIKFKYILLCVFFLGVSDAGFSSLYPSYLIDNGFIDKEIGQINFFAGTLALIFYPFMGKIIDKYNKVLIFNLICIINLFSLIYLNFTENYYSIIFCTAFFYFSLGSVFLICFNIIGLNLKKNLIIYGVASYTISENIGSFLGPNVIGNIISININYFFGIFVIFFLFITFVFNFFQNTNNNG
tara:strand:- start:731 stop:1855 length:1125 start_codon:yes stop_codon:yes gene_type:complete